ncbi:hypothetical protein V6N13_130238 [Hibiscus sabdariffa]
MGSSVSKLRVAVESKLKSQKARAKMEDRAELDSILPYLPLEIGSSRRLLWPSKVVEALEALSKGPDHSRVNCGEVLSIAISDIRASLSLADPLAPSAPQGYALFFDELMSRADSTNWFAQDIPKLANLLLRLPFLVDVHYQNAQTYGYGLRILGQQESGVVLLSQRSKTSANHQLRSIVCESL